MLRRLVREGIEGARVIKQLCCPSAEFVGTKERESEQEAASQRWEEQHGDDP